jgi:hypothetical protein
VEKVTLTAPRRGNPVEVTNRALTELEQSGIRIVWRRFLHTGSLEVRLEMRPVQAASLGAALLATGLRFTRAGQQALTNLCHAALYLKAIGERQERETVEVLVEVQTISCGVAEMAMSA